MPYKNKEDQKASAARHYQRNREKMIKRALVQNAKAKVKARDYILNYLLSHPCVDCGEDDPIVLEFDHVSGDKLANISDLCVQGYSLKMVESEILKCNVRCANCHRRITHRRRNL